MKYFNLKIGMMSLFLLTTSCSEKTSKLIPVAQILSEDVTQKPLDLVSFKPKVDILFVIDNSASMSDAQNNLSRNAYLFADAISKISILDFHIGITSTDMSNCSGGCGNLMGRPAFFSNSTPNIATSLAANLVIGINGSGYEEMFSPVISNLSNMTGPNTGFYRQDAYFAVIFITDAMDQSTYSATQLSNFLLNLKKDKNKILGYGVIRKLAQEQQCGPFSEDLDSKIEDFLASVVNADKAQNNVLSLCDSDYGTKLAGFANDIVKRSSGTLRLTRLPDVKTISVSYGTQVIPNSVTDGWIYEPSTNSLLFSSDIQWIDQGPGVGVTVNFEAISL